jgi:DNA-binding CsgD family transcriptional regulator
MHYSMGLKVPLGEIPSAYFSCQRSKSNGPFAEREGLVYETLMPHLQRALALYWQMIQMQSKVLGLETALDALHHAVFGLDRKGKVVLSNRSAEAIVKAGDALRLSNGILSSILPEQNRRLQVAVTGAVAAGNASGISSGAALLIDRKSQTPPLRITVTPFLSPVPGSSAQLAALVFVSDPTSRPQPSGITLKALYGLTPTEVRLADLLLEGADLRKIAERLGMTIETTRFHTKRVLAKTGTRRQNELIKLMLSLPQC